MIRTSLISDVESRVSDWEHRQVTSYFLFLIRLR